MSAVTCLVVVAFPFYSCFASRDFQQGSSLTQARIVRTSQVSVEQLRWDDAVEEAHMDPATISEFGKAVPKFSASVVALLSRFSKREKRRTYNFQGRLIGSANFNHGMDEFERRKWVIDFATSNFSSHDFFFATDASAIPGYKTLGEFDRSLQHARGLDVFGPNRLTDLASMIQVSVSDIEGLSNLYDIDYYAEMSATNFTLCPGGDTPWSMRAYESAVVGALCLIQSPEEDWNVTTSKAYTDIEKRHLERLFSMYHYVRVDEPHTYRQDWADENFATFIKYQTFVQGDNIPPDHS